MSPAPFFIRSGIRLFLDVSKIFLYAQQKFKMSNCINSISDYGQSALLIDNANIRIYNNYAIF